MINRSSLRRAYFAAVAALALLVAVVGLLLPHSLPEVLPFDLPPLHARFVGALYAGGAICMLLAWRTRSALAVRSTLDLTAMWTGALLCLTALRWGDFDLHHKGLWVWLAAYLAFPLGAWWLRRTEAPLPVPPRQHVRQGWVLALLRTQGMLLLAVAVGLFAWPGAAGVLWPWRISAFLAQVYAGPLLAVSLTCLLLAHRRHWAELGPPCTGMAVFAGLAVLASALHLPLFDPARVVTWCWLAGLCAIGAGSAWLAHLAARQGRANPQWATQRQGAVA
jgi:hypothetical protein